MFDNVKWLFFDVGSTLVDEHIAYEHRLKDIAALANVPYEYVYAKAMEFYKQNKKGDSKPDRRIFEIVLERSNCKPDEAIMIGDRVDNDIVPAKLLGMHTICIKQGFRQYWNITKEIERADITVNSLMEICDVLNLSEGAI